MVSENTNLKHFTISTGADDGPAETTSSRPDQGATRRESLVFATLAGSGARRAPCNSGTDWKNMIGSGSLNLNKVQNSSEELEPLRRRNVPSEQPKQDPHQRERIKTLERHRRVSEYDEKNHWSVLFQIYGSVWPQVLPWCLIMVLYTYGIWALRENGIVNLTLESSTGHVFMGTLVSFLVVTRTTITYNRFMEARQGLQDLFRSTREVVHYACLLTNRNKQTEAVQWRQEVAYRAIASLRMAIASVEYRGHGINAWQALPEEDHERTELFLDLDEFERQEESTKETATCSCTGTSLSQSSSHASFQSHHPTTGHSNMLQDLAHGPRTVEDENNRAPIVWGYNLREHILLTRADPNILSTRELKVVEELAILSGVSEWMKAMHDLQELIDTPFPFPLVQMTRTFLLFWILSLPLVLLTSEVQAPQQLAEVFLVMFFCTFGFMGLEYVNMELDDPYGNDPNDFPGQSWAELVFEDVYIAIYKTDGYESADQLRSRITKRMTRRAAFD